MKTKGFLKNTNSARFAKLAFVAVAMSGTAQAAVVTFPQAALVPSNYYYTDLIGGGLGTAMVTTGGGNAANVGNTSGPGGGSPNDDGFRNVGTLQALAGFSAGYQFNSIASTQGANVFVNNNGNISFTAGIAAFTPSGPQGAAQPIISPFFADVDTRASGMVYYRNTAPGELVVTWDNVGFFNSHASPTNSFQLVLRDPAVYNIPVGQGAIGFFWKGMGWETGDASSGSGGFGGTPAAVGFGDGVSNGVVLEGSTANGIAAVVQNHNTWFNQDLSVSCGLPGLPPCSTALPEPETLPLFATGLFGLAGVYWRRQSSKANKG